MIYLLKASLILSVFYLLYRTLLYKETFYQSNRAFLLIGLTSTLIFPLIYLKKYVVLQPISLVATPSGSLTETGASIAAFDWTQFSLYIYLAVASFFVARLIWQSIAVLTLITKSTYDRHNGFRLIKTNDAIQPFSFFNYIVINTSNYTEKEIDQIIAHENVHVRQRHSLDLILSHLFCALLWFNPFAWLYKRALEQNLEFIADSEAQHTISTNSYQYTLLKTAIPNYQMALTNNFFNSLIKNRIMMLNKPKSKTINQLKMVLVLPFLALFLMSMNTKTVPVFAETEGNPESKTTLLGDIDIMVVTKDMTDDQLDALSEKMKANDITLKFKNVKRNKDGEITKISISAKSKKSTVDLSQSDDDGIEPITIKVDGDAISIGEANRHSHDEDYDIHHADGKVKVVKSKGGNSVFVYSDSDDEHHEVIEDDEKIIIKRNGKVHEIKKGEGNSYVIEDDGENIEVITDEKKVIIKEGKDGKVSKIHINHDDDEENVWVSDEGENTFKIKTVGKGKDKVKVFMSSSDDGENPLYIIDGKEVTEKEFSSLDSDDIETINVLKGKSAEKKYGKKGENGVIEVVTKKD